MTETSIIVDKEVEIRDGTNLSSTIFTAGNVLLSIRGHPGAVGVDIHITREQAMTLSRNLEEIVAAYDATVDRYHEVCDEPVTAEAH